MMRWRCSGPDDRSWSGRDSAGLAGESVLSTEEAFRRLTIGDPALLHGPDGAPLSFCGLDERTETLLRIAALIAVDAPASSYRPVVEAALRAGIRREELPAALIAVAGIVGSARVAAAAPRIALAVGYDVEAALE
jgi:alkylhydroperoxidase/carboxymuconolactone decarboxylase family protein YurZ